MDASAAAQDEYRQGGHSRANSQGYYDGGYAAPVVYTRQVIYRPVPV